MNNFCGVGRISRDIELKKTQSGTSVANFNLAINRQFKKEGQPDADFIQCVAWGKTADNLANYMSKGSLIAIEGRMETRNYENADGQKIYVTEIICNNITYLDSKGNQAPQETKKDFFADFEQGNTSDILSGLDISDDELPF